MQKSLRGLEKFFWLYLLFNPILDIVNGLYIWMLTRGYGMEALNYRELTNGGGMTTTPALVVRMVVLLIMVIYVLMLRDKQAILTALPMGAAWAMSVLSEFLWTGTANISLDVTFFARFAYNVAVAMVYLNVFRNSELSKDRLIEKYTPMSTV
ncbi:MAG: O-antigen ligase family protein [Butyricicoccus pullicaecorum]